MFATVAKAWDSVGDMESEACMALTNVQYLASNAYADRLKAALSTTNEAMRVNAQLMLGVSHYQRFLETLEEGDMERYCEHMSNAVVQAVPTAADWRYWTARLLYAGSFAARDDFSKSYAILTNCLDSMDALCCVSPANALDVALLSYYELRNISIKEAFKVMAGMSAAELGMGSAATNYANQISPPYRDLVLEFVR